eukprot:1151186-Pelagomonas_calceolata.AAC.1
MRACEGISRLQLACGNISVGRVSVWVSLSVGAGLASIAKAIERGHEARLDIVALQEHSCMRLGCSPNQDATLCQCMTSNIVGHHL